MKVYIICFNNEHIAYPTAFLDREMAEECLKIMQDAHADYSDWYSVQEMEMERPLRLNTEETLKLLELLDKDANL